MSGIELALVCSWAAFAAGAAWHAASVASEATYVMLADGRRQERSLPLLIKLFLPFTGRLDRLVSRPFFSERVTRAGVTLVAAGFEGLVSGREFVALQLLVPLVGGAVWCAAVSGLAVLTPGSALSDLCAPVCAIGVAILALRPSMWLSGALRRRHTSIMKALPFVMDLLTLSVEAGMDFISALQRNCAIRRMDPLNEELLRMTKEIQVGSSRKDALRAMAERCRQPDLRAVANALVQADELGASIGPVLRIQSEQLRSRRFDRAEKLAHEAPTKMLGPLMLCIFPAVFIILLGPVLSQALKGMF